MTRDEMTLGGNENLGWRLDPSFWILWFGVRDGY